MTSAEDQVKVEAELAKQLADAPPEERQALYSEVYDRIYEMHFSRAPETLEFGAHLGFMPMLEKLSSPGDRVLEVGCGAGLMAVELARRGRRVTGLEVSEVILERARERAADVDGVELMRVEGTGLPFPDASFDFAYSIEVLEHLHEADGAAHIAEVARVLRPGGRYWFLTPSPWESTAIDERFGVEVEVDADVHLKEWTYGELKPVLERAGFRRARVPVRDHRALSLPFVPMGLIVGFERVVARSGRHSLLQRLVNRISVVAER